MHVALCALGLVGVNDVLTVHAAHDHRAGGAVPRNIGNSQGNGGTDHGGDFRGHVLLHGQDGHHHLHVVAHALVEQGTQGAVDQAAGQGRLLGGTALALDEAAGDLAHGVLLLLHVNSQREEVHAGTGGGGHGGVHHDDGVAQVHPHAAGSLLAILAEFQGQRTARQIHGILLGFHWISPFCVRAGEFRRPAARRCYHMKTPFSAGFSRDNIS